MDEDGDDDEKRNEKKYENGDCLTAKYFDANGIVGFDEATLCL